MDNSECGVPDNTNVNMKYQIQFMKEEYNQMFNSWFNLKKEKADYIKTYITLVTLPLTIIIAIMRISNPDPTAPLNILALIDPLKPMFLIISFLGFLITAILIDTRLESIMYIRNINSIRKAFCELNNKFKLSEVLKLPLSPDKPNFREFYFFSKGTSLTSVIYHDLLFTAFINSIYFFMFIGNMFVSLLFFAAHIIFYIYVSDMKEEKWNNELMNQRAQKPVGETSIDTMIGRRLKKLKRFLRKFNPARNLV